MEKLGKIVSSRTVWVLVILVATNIVSAYSDAVSPEMLTLIDSVLGALAVYFKVTPSQRY